MLSVNARARDRALHEGSEGVPARRTDFGALTEALGAFVVDWETADARPLTKWLRRRFGFGPVAALLLFFRRGEFDVAWCFSEVEGLLLALLLKLSRSRRQVFVIGVELLSWKCLLLLRWLRVWTHFTALLPTSSYQACEVVRRGRVPREKVLVFPYQVDSRYFAPPREKRMEKAPYVVAVGLESRDYATLAEAVSGLDVEVRVAAASLWAGRARPLPAESLPPNVHLRSYRYEELRDLYAGAVLAVVPLYQSAYQHGVTAIQEAMAMGLAVVATRTVGQGDVLVDRRKLLRGNPRAATAGGFAALLAPGRPDLARPSGHYVGVGDAAALRRSIAYLLDHPEDREQLGKQGRLVAEELLSVDKFVSRAERLVAAAWAGEPLSQELLRA